jgi:hypothetical protein
MIYTYQEKAKALYDQMEYKKFQRGDEEDTRVIIKDDAADRQELIDLTYKVNESTSLSMDSTYKFTMEALALIADSEANNEDDLFELSSQFEADPYTGQLTEWLNESNFHVYYLTQAIEEGLVKDGFEALSMAQVLAKTDVLDVVVNHLTQ